MVTLHILQLKSCPVFQQLQIEEALLRADERNWCLVNEGSPSAIVMGISGKPELLINEEHLAHKPVPVIRRFSGGGTVFVDEQTQFITLIGNSEQLQVPCCPQKILQWTHSLYLPVFQHPQFQVKENDYVFGDRKFGGNAQYMRKNRWLHHSSLLWDFHPENMNYLKIPPRMPEYRQKRGHIEFLCRLRDHMAARDEIVKKLLKELKCRFHLVEVQLHEIDEVKKLPHRKATEKL